MLPRYFPLYLIFKYDEMFYILIKQTEMSLVRGKWQVCLFLFYNACRDVQLKSESAITPFKSPEKFAQSLYRDFKKVIN